MFVTALFVQGLLATAALAIPSPKERFEQRVARRAAAAASAVFGGVPQTVPVKLLEKQGGDDGEAHQEFSSNWAGVVLAEPEVHALSSTRI